MKQPPKHVFQQLNLTLAEARPAELPSAQQTQLEAALAELFLSVARACLNPGPGGSDESEANR
jgi:hypothetical protein